MTNAAKCFDPTCTNSDVKYGICREHAGLSPYKKTHTHRCLPGRHTWVHVSDHCVRDSWPCYRNHVRPTLRILLKTFWTWHTHTCHCGTKTRCKVGVHSRNPVSANQCYNTGETFCVDHRPRCRQSFMSGIQMGKKAWTDCTLASSHAGKHYSAVLDAWEIDPDNYPTHTVGKFPRTQT